jgi:hypothetical protein
MAMAARKMRGTDVIGPWQDTPFKGTLLFPTPTVIYFSQLGPPSTFLPPLIVYSNFESINGIND